MQSRRPCGTKLLGLFPIKEEAPIPLKSLEISVDIIHNVAKVTFTQVYYNSSHSLMESEYFFPISPDACFDSFEAKFNDTVIKGVVKEKNKAKEEYKEAVNKGNTAAYSEINEETGDIMKVLIGNIPPKTDISITYSYIQKLEVEQNKFWCFRLFSTLTPRYKGRFADNLTRDIDLLARYPTISSGNCQAYPWNIKVELQSPSPVKFLESPSHEIVKTYGNENHTCTITLDPKIIYKPNKDFVLLFSNDKENMMDYVMTPFDDGYCAMVTMVADFKQNQESAKDVYAKLKKPMAKEEELEEVQDMSKIKGEYIFLIDQSGSMKGDRIKMACSALQLFLKSLPANSYFNVVSFGSQFRIMFQSSVKYSQESLDKACKLIGEFQADMGGTQIYYPLDHLFKARLLKGSPRTFFLLTDGAVANTSQVLNLIAQNSHKTRVFTIGIGNGCSAELVTKSAVYGNGKHEFVQDEKDIYEKVISLLDASLSPCYSDLSLRSNNFDAVVQSVSPNPSTVISLIDGQSITFFLFLRKAAFEGSSKMPLQLRLYDSRIDNYRTVEIVLDTEDSFENECLPKLAIHDMIKQMEQENSNVLWMNKKEIKDALIDLSVKHGILSKETAFICEITKTTNDGSHKNLPKIKTIVPTIISHDYPIHQMTKSGNIGGFKATCRSSATLSKAKASCEAMDSVPRYKMEEKGQRREALTLKPVSSNMMKTADVKNCKLSAITSSMTTPIAKPVLAPSYLDVLMKQNFEGFWNSDDEALKELVLKKKDLPAVPEGLGELDGKLWMTLLILLWLEKAHNNERKAWRLVHQKGCEWLKLRGVNYDYAKTLVDPINL